MKAALEEAESFDLRSGIRESHRRFQNTRLLLATTARLRADITALVEQSTSLIRQSRRLAPYPIQGGSDDVGIVIGALAGGAAMCADCIARKAEIPVVEIPSLIERVREVFCMQSPYVPCAVCLTTRKVYRMHDPGASDLRLVMVAVWNRRMCLTCLSARTGIPIARIEEIFAVLGRVVPVTRSASDCDGCSTPRDVVALV